MELLLENRINFQSRFLSNRNLYPYFPTQTQAQITRCQFVKLPYIPQRFIPWPQPYATQITNHNKHNLVAYSINCQCKTWESVVSQQGQCHISYARAEPLFLYVFHYQFLTFYFCDVFFFFVFQDFFGDLSGHINLYEQLSICQSVDIRSFMLFQSFGHFSVFFLIFVVYEFVEFEHAHT